MTDKEKGCPYLADTPEKHLWDLMNHHDSLVRSFSEDAKKKRESNKE